MDNPYINPSNQDGNDNLNNQQDSYYHTANNADNTVSNDQAGYGDGFNKEMFGQPTNIGVTSFTQTTFGQQTNVNQQTSFGQPGSDRNQQYNGPVVQTVDQMYNNMQAREYESVLWQSAIRKSSTIWCSLSALCGARGWQGNCLFDSGNCFSGGSISWLDCGHHRTGTWTSGKTCW